MPFSKSTQGYQSTRAVNYNFVESKHNLKSSSYRHTQFDIKMQLLQFDRPKFNGCTKIAHSHNKSKRKLLWECLILKSQKLSCTQFQNLTWKYSKRVPLTSSGFPGKAP